MDSRLRILTVGMKPAVNEALAERDDLRVVAMTHGATEATDRGRLRVLPYHQRSKISRRCSADIREAIDAFRPDIVQTYGSRPLAHAVMALLGRRDRPKLFSYRGVTSRASRLRIEDWLTYLSPLVDAHACESQASMDGLLAGGVRRERCFLAYNCLTRPPKPAVSRAALAEFGIPEDAFVVASVANFRRVKGGDLLVEAAKRCVDLPSTHFLLLGEVRDKRINQLAADPSLAGRVHLAGFRSDAMDLASTADLFAMPSRAEALCVALLEAMSMGVCPIVSDAGGMKEAVRDGIDGVVVPAGSSEALSAAIRRLHSDRDLLASYGRSAAERFAAMFDRGVVADRFAAAYRRIADVGSSPVAA